MVVLCEKDVVPPPPYEQPSNAKPASTSESTPGTSTPQNQTATGTSTRRTQHVGRVSAPTLPAHVQLLIVYATLPRPGELVNTFAADGSRIKVRESAEATTMRTTRTLYWIAFYLRLVNRGFYLASMHLLRSTFLADYTRLVRAPYSTDPFPHTSLAASVRQRGPVVSTLQCEAQILDLYILHRLHEDVFAADSSLHIDRANLASDLFAFMQPRARLADLLRAFGAGAGLVDLGGSSDSDDANADERLVSLAESHRAREHELMRARLRERAAAVNAARAPALLSVGASSLVEGKGASLKSRSQISLPSYQSRPPSPAPAPPPGPVAGPSSSSASKAVEAGYSFDIDDDADRKSSHSHSSYSYAYTSPTRQRRIPHTTLRVTFSPRRVGLLYVPSGAPVQHQTVADLARSSDEPLERAASRLVAALKTWLDARPEYS